MAKLLPNGTFGSNSERKGEVMRLVVIDGQSGRMGSLFIQRVREARRELEIIAVGTNAIATAAMLKAGASAGATGENAVVVACRRADVVAGPVGILAADALWGEVTAAMAAAIGRSGARKLLFPVNQCGIVVAGTQAMPLAKLMDEAAALLGTMLEERT